MKAKTEKPDLKTDTFFPQNLNQAAAKQTYFTLWLAAKPKQVMCLLAYVCPQDKLIRLSPRPCFIRDEFIIILPDKSTTISQANTIWILCIYLLDSSCNLSPVSTLMTTLLERVQ